MYLAGMLIMALAGCEDSTTNENTNSLSETMVTIPIENKTTSTDNKELTFNEKIKEYMDKKKYFTLFSIGKPYWEHEGELIRSTEYIDKYPTSYQSLISVDTFKSVPSDNDPFEETLNVVTGKKYEKTKVVFYIEDVEDNVIVYAETDLDTDSSIQKEVKY